MSFTDIFKKDFLTAYSSNEITFKYTIISMGVCMIISLLICIIYYIKARKSFYSKEFAVSIIVLAVITTSIILTIQSSIVVSLGMVGALSIVRFRTAVKKPLDLVFLFWSIATGIICGTGLYYIAITVTFVVGIIILLSDEIPVVSKNKILVLNSTYPCDENEYISIIKKYVRYYNIRTESIHNDSINFIIEIRGVKDEMLLLKELKEIKELYDISILVQEGAID